ncbi:MAG: polysaccharide lyase family 1 protein [Treponema sp.]|nr:polysaccharide lyase family 1 protein [Treponema sp.]MBR0032468.1 polysaccharide lyase family 1 protein [Treponema sp.]
MKKNFLAGIAFACASLCFSQIKATDRPSGFASVGAKSQFGGNPEKSVVVTNVNDLRKYAGEGGYVIYVSGMIDITDGMLPDTAFSETEKLNEFISKNTGGAVKSWSEWKTKFALCMKKNTDYTGGGRHAGIDSSMDKYFGTLLNKWKGVVLLNVASDTTIIGLDGSSGLKGGSLQLSGVENVAIRNLILQDAFDPFPHHEDGDGWNAEYDCLCVVSSKNIWIDHVTFQDTISVGKNAFAHVKLGDKSDEKYQTTDGFLDIKGSSAAITISYCHFLNHDKTCLWGASDKERLSETRTITAHHNYFHNCVQRLPMVRLADLHLYNNYYDVDKKSSFQSSYAIGARFSANINSEGNYFGSGIKYSVQGASKNYGSFYSSGDVDKSSGGKRTDQFTSAKKPLFEVPYEYSVEEAKNLNKVLPAQVGSGVLEVER